MGRNGESSISELPTLCKERKGWGTRQTGRFLAANRKGGFGGRPELSLVEATRFAPYIHSFALASTDVKKECDSRQNLGVAPVRLELTTSKVRT